MGTDLGCEGNRLVVQRSGGVFSQQLRSLAHLLEKRKWMPLDILKSVPDYFTYYDSTSVISILCSHIL